MVIVLGTAEVELPTVTTGTAIGTAVTKDGDATKHAIAKHEWPIRRGIDRDERTIIIRHQCASRGIETIR